LLQRPGTRRSCGGYDPALNHLGYASHGGRILPAVEVEGVLEGLGKLDLFARLEAVLTGYLGQAASAAAGAITAYPRGKIPMLFIASIR